MNHKPTKEAVSASGRKKKVRVIDVRIASGQGGQEVYWERMSVRICQWPTGGKRKKICLTGIANVQDNAISIW